MSEVLEAIKGAISREANSKIAFTWADQGTVRNSCDGISRFCLDLVFALNRRQGEVVRAVEMVFASLDQGNPLPAEGTPVPATRREEREQRLKEAQPVERKVEGKKATGNEGEEGRRQGEGKKKRKRRNCGKKKKKELRDAIVREVVQRTDARPREPEVVVTERATVGGSGARTRRQQECSGSVKCGRQ